MNFSVCCLGPKGHVKFMSRDPAHALTQAGELSSRGYADVLIADPHGQLYHVDEFLLIFGRPTPAPLVAPATSESVPQ